jgi:hypothetical protein
MKHFVGVKKEQGLVAALSDFNRWFGDAESENLRKVWLRVVPCVVQQIANESSQNFKAMEKAHLAEV